eukprot:CAMPEP_0197540924 /NCGR_PEP_ID=MMETSP1318-20131121/66873_1 /TAXON_ID=552666 /ORGANISM="Partenskyella glossopodia, Strain RCC365" /LENGTH=203 /DNA_ID=CAMNT_0043100039 /DNA_START=175 /DNA_END=783 /DNA_ORIENTATION=+
MAFTSNTTLVLAHLSSISNYTESDIIDIANHHPRLVVNCYRYFTKAYHGSLAHAHLRNIQWAMGLGINISHVLLWASNSWFIRRGIENYVNKHGSSLTNLEGTVRKNAFVQRLDVGRILPDPRPGWAPKEVFSRVWSWKPFREVIAPKAPAGSPVNTVTLSKHEGAFFPGPLMQKIVKAFDEDMFESLAEQHVYMEEFLFQTW